MFSALRNPCCSPSKSTNATGTPLSRRAFTIVSDWPAGTTLSSLPWKKMTGRETSWAWCSGDRAA